MSAPPKFELRFKVVMMGDSGVGKTAIITRVADGTFLTDHVATVGSQFVTLNLVVEGRRVLLAEDVALNQEIVLALLEPTGLIIDCADNGAEALNIYSAAPEKYDIIFMDVQMPEMDGYEATGKIRELEKSRPDIEPVPIIAMTANVFREDIEKCLEAGMNDHVGKPLDVEEVLAKLRQYLGG
jgi:CheY-like chemotaxis protein